MSMFWILAVGCVPKLGELKPPEELQLAAALPVAAPTVVLQLENDGEDKLTAPLAIDVPAESLKGVENIRKAYEEFLELEYSADDEENAKLILIRKDEEMKELTQAAFDMIMEEKNYYEVAAGIYLGAATELRYADMILRYPVPRKLSEMGQLVFQERLIGLVVELEDGGKGRMEKLVSNAIQTGIRGEWAEKALQDLQLFFPMDYYPIPSSHESPLDAQHAYLKMTDRSQYWPQEHWPETAEKKKALAAKLRPHEENLAGWYADCEILRNEIPGFSPLAALYCLGRNAGMSELIIARNPTGGGEKLKEAGEAYKAAGLAALAYLEDDETEDGAFWALQLKEELRAVNREKSSILRQREGDLVISGDDAEQVWHYRDEAEVTDPEVGHHLKIHAHRIHFYAERINRKVKRPPSGRAEKLEFFKVTAPQELQKVYDEGMRVLSLYPESHGERDRILMAVGLAYGNYADKLFDSMGRMPFEEFELLMDLAATQQTTGLRLLMLAGEREGHRSQWGTRAATELRRLRP
jgi:hypothetical protein